MQQGLDALPRERSLAVTIENRLVNVIAQHLISVMLPLTTRCRCNAWIMCVLVRVCVPATCVYCTS